MKLFTFLFLFLGAINFTNAQTLNVPYQKKPLLFKMTATWCTPCGEYLWITDSIYNAHKDSIVFINSHVSTSEIGDLYSGDFHNALNLGGGIPAYNVDGTKIDAWPPSYTDIMNFANAQFDATIVANIAFTSQFSGNSVTVSTTTKFFEDASGEFYVNVFLLENELVANQSMDAGSIPVVHERVSRGPIMSGNSGMWGELIEANSVSAGSEYDVSFTANIPSSWNTNHMDIVAVVWQKNAGEYTVLNSEDKEGSAISTAAIAQESNLEKLHIFPNPTSDQITIDGITETQSFELIDISGKVVLTGEVSEKANTIDLSDRLLKGNYHLRIGNDLRGEVYKIVIQ
ncbi:MAG: Omp28-related outer membrane protein [Crocinitomicaceae bacterium]|nr:Omp28-related outer membrane protein [Crocinitomicaceae bacterium]